MRTNYVLIVHDEPLVEHGLKWAMDSRAISSLWPRRFDVGGLGVWVRGAGRIHGAKLDLSIDDSQF
jgi:hypothetical protein